MQQGFLMSRADKGEYSVLVRQMPTLVMCRCDVNDLFILNEFLELSRGVKIHSAHDTIRIMILGVRYNTYHDI